MGYYRARNGHSAIGADNAAENERRKRTFIGRYVLIKPHRALCTQGIERLTALVSSNNAGVYNDIDSLVDGRSDGSENFDATTAFPIVILPLPRR